MNKSPVIGFLLVLLVAPVVVFAKENTGPEVIDSTCKPYAGNRERIADSKKSRLPNNLFAGLEGKRIRHIDYKNLSVFNKDDPDENNRIYMFLNKLHYNTRPSVIRTQLLFKEGDQLVIPQIQESERILRKRDYLSNAYIVPQTVCDTQVDITVVTQDSWALEPQVSVSRESEGTQSGFAIADGNILGTGSSLTIGYEENTDRNSVSYDISNPHIFNSQISTRLYYADTSDGRNSIIKVEHPFYSLDTPWAAGFYTEETALVDLIRHTDKEINEFRHTSMFNEVYFGLATDINADFTQRWLVGISNEEDEFFPTKKTLQAIPENRKAVYPWIEYQYLQNRFGVFKNVNQIQRAEDIALGENFTFRLGYAGTQFDNPDDVIRYIGSYTNILDVGEQHILEAGITLDGRRHSNLENIDSNVVKLNFAYNYFQDEKNRWYASINYDVGKDLAQYEELTVGDVTGLRGYPSDYQRGDERYVLTIERRYFSDIHIFNLLRVGTVVFFDVGKAWGVDQYGESPLLSDVGFGLRLSSTKVRIGNVVHVDIATPTSARNREGVGKYQLTIGAQKKF